MNTNDDQIFSNEQIQRYDADTIKHRYGDNWRNYASNVREIKQADGSIVREYIIEDPSLLKELKPSVDSTSSSTAGSDDEQQQQLSKNKFAQIKAKFEQKSLVNVMASPSSSSVASSDTATRRNSNKQIDDLNIRNRRESNDSLANNRTHIDIPIAPTISNSNNQHSRSVSNSSFQRLNSADEADEEVRRLHRQGHELHHHQGTLTPISSINNETKQQSNIQYEVVDENGNSMAIDDVHDLIQMSGVTAREVPQADGTLIREYVIDDPNVLSKFHSQQRTPNEHIPPPPPRIPLKQSMLFREPLSNDHHHPPPINIQQIRTLETQRRYEFMTTSGKRIEFIITSLGSDESDIHELANAINTRLLTSSANTTQQPFTLPKQWHPAVDLTHREPQTRSRIGSDNQPILNNYNTGFQQVPPIQMGLDRSASYGVLNQGPYPQQFAPVFTEPIIDWSAVRQQDPHGQVDPQLIRQFITQKHQSGSFQTSAQFLPEQQQIPQTTYSPPRNNSSIPYQQTMSYPYQGQQQHGVRILSANNNDYNFNQQQIPNGHTRI